MKMNKSDVATTKWVVRFMSDILQLGVYRFAHVTRLWAFFFPNDPLILNLITVINILSHVRMCTGDDIYWYLGLALLVMPYLPMLLERCFGIPVTRGLVKCCDGLVQILIYRGLLNGLSENGDTERLTQGNDELSRVDKNVKKGKENWTNMKNRLSSARSYFFAQNEDEIQQEQYGKRQGKRKIFI